ncbi:MAG TPA: hypothetical protein VFB85_01415 [Vicinamibacterales bacterium]|nr:hypothetical protein [Vicinamibacterales bacterium]
MQDEFYIGYEAEMPRGLDSRIRRTAAAVLLIALVVSSMLVFAHRRSADATFEYGRERVFEGRLIEFPYPALLVSGAHAPTSYWLVGPGKHGAAGLVAGRDGAIVRITGSLIEREHDHMIELRSLAMVTGVTLPAVEPLRSLGPIVLSGEIVDSKCHLGVMKPGEGPTHRDCAVRCLLGRITPMFATHSKGPGPRPQASERATAFWPSARWGLGPEAWGLQDRLALVDPAGRAFDAPLDTLVGRPVVIRGELLSRGPLRFLATTPAAIQVQENGASFLNVASTQR